MGERNAKTDIIRDVTEILKNKFNVQVEEIEHISLLDPAIGMLPRDLFTLFLIWKVNMI